MEDNRVMPTPDNEIEMFLDEMRADLETRRPFRDLADLRREFGKVRAEMLPYYPELESAYRFHGYEAGVIKVMPTEYNPAAARRGRRLAACMFQVRDEFAEEIVGRPRRPVDLAGLEVEPPPLRPRRVAEETVVEGERVDNRPPLWDVRILDPDETGDERDPFELVPTLTKVKKGGRIRIRVMSTAEGRRIQHALWNGLLAESGWYAGIDGEVERPYRSRILEDERGHYVEVRRLIEPAKARKRPKKKY